MKKLFINKKNIFVTAGTSVVFLLAIVLIVLINNKFINQPSSDHQVTASAQVNEELIDSTSEPTTADVSDSTASSSLTPSVEGAHSRSRTATPAFPSALPTNTNMPSTSSKSKLADLSSSFLKEIKKLDEYQNIYGGYLTNQVMFFTSIPTTTSLANSQASEMSLVLKEYSRLGITPLVIVEPAETSGGINFQSYKSGTYDSAIDQYFKQLKASGVTDAQLGIWTPFPEVNIPEWGKSLSPSDFVAIINRYIKILRKYYPTAQTSILLDSMTYKPEDTSWSNGAYASLVPFVTGIESGLVNSFGLQGFPWKPEKSTGGYESKNPSEFLDPKEATDAADKLGIKNIWFNTGTFSSMYTNSKTNMVTSTPEERKTILTAILQNLIATKSKGYKVTVNIFAEDKSTVGEAVNWSYWKLPTDTNKDKQYIMDFFRTAQSTSIGISIYDIKK